jgi:Fe-Mn family superoxide dismutase
MLLLGTDMEGKTIENILLNLDLKNTAVRNNGGGFTTIIFGNYVTKRWTSYWRLLEAIESDFGSFDEFKAKFSKARATQFGSGWAWLCVSKAETRRLWNSKSRQSINA